MEEQHEWDWINQAYKEGIGGIFRTYRCIKCGLIETAILENPIKTDVICKRDKEK